MGLLELFVAVLIVGISAINAAVPLAAWRRAGDGRFLLLSGASLAFGLLGLIWTWGTLPLGPPEYAEAELPVLLVALLAVLLLLVSSLWPRKRV